MTASPAPPEDDAAEVWGYMAGAEFRPLPKRPLLQAGLGPPPFSVELPTGETRHVIVRPKRP